jgi:hypothetical protein
MDPSEFEDTVEKSVDVISAGALEDFFQPTKARFVAPDLSEALGDCYRLLYDLQDQLKRIPGDDQLENILNGNDEQAVKITELKEEYIQRRKKLIGIVKKFSTTQLDPLIASGTQSENVISLATECKDIIELFKKEYEFLSTFNKLVEQSFLSAYKLSLSIPELQASIADAVEKVLKQQDVLKKCQEQFEIANQLIADGSNEARSSTDGGKHVDGSNSGNNHHSEGGNLTSSISIHDIVPTASTTNRQLEASIQKLQDELEREKANHAAELLQLKNHHEVELRNREYSIQSKYEEQSLKQQQQYESLLSNKEEKLQLLAQELENNKLKALAFDEKLQVLEAETKKRQQSEEKCQQLMIEVTDLQQLLQSKEKEREKLIVAFESNIEELQLKLKGLQNELDTMKEKLSSTELELLSRPPIDLSTLLERVGLQHKIWGEACEDSLTNNNKEKRQQRIMPWKEVESMLVDQIRKCENDLVTIRIKEQEDAETIQRITDQNSDIQRKLKIKENELANVEKDLWQAHEALQQLKQNQHRNHSSGNHWDRHLSKSRGSKLQRDKDESSLILNHEQKSMTSSVGGITYEEMDDLLKSTHDKELPGANVSQQQQPIDCVSEVVPVTIEEGTLSSSSILQAVQHQRDRYMKAARELEEEIATLKTKYEKLQEEQNSLRNDNLELYRRVRLLRQLNPHSSSSSQAVTTTANSTARDVRSRRGWNESMTRYDEEENGFNSTAESLGNPTDHIDRRYNALYEQEMLSPFKIADLEKQQYLSRMNVMDRTIALIYRNVMQDAWARHAFLIYFGLVHVFALFYVFQVLNPQLIEEVDAHLKAKWSAETMNLPEHPDV